MAKTLTVSYKGEDYTLEINRKTVEFLEQHGFVVKDLADKPATLTPLLFYGAFRKNYPGIKRKVVEEIFDNLENKDGLIEALIEMYVDTLDSLLTGSGEGNAKWGKNW
mgnify:CR=1 FL=1